MKTLIISFSLFFCLVFLSSYCAGQPSLPAHYESKETLVKDAEKVIADFSSFINDSGYGLPAIPKIKIQTEPSLIRVDRQANVVIIPYWGDLPEEQKNLFRTWRGEKAEQLFILLFNWFFIPHEMGHYINPAIHDLDPYQCEKEANQVAVAFFRRDPVNSARLDSLKKILPRVLAILPKIDFGTMSEKEYFNTWYQKLGNNPNAYGYFQLKFIINILNDPGNFDISHYFDNVQQDTSVSFTKDGAFVLGCNYWASHASARMWSDWKPEIVEADFRQISEAGMQVIRLFPLWPDFQPIYQYNSSGESLKEVGFRDGALPAAGPGKDGVSQEAPDHFRKMADLAGKYDIKLIVGRVTGWMSGQLFVPPAFKGMKILTDPTSLMWQVRLVRTFVNEFRDHPAILAWDLGNECNVMEPVSNSMQAYVWTTNIANAIRVLKRACMASCHRNQ